MGNKAKKAVIKDKLKITFLNRSTGKIGCRCFTSLRYNKIPEISPTVKKIHVFSKEFEIEKLAKAKIMLENIVIDNNIDNIFMLLNVFPSFLGRLLHKK